MARIEIKNLNLGGIADSDYLGGEGSVAEAVGLDIHSESGVVKLNQKLTKESGVVVDDLIKVLVPCSDGSTYGFGSTNGKVFKRTSGGTWTNEATVAPAAGAVGVLGAAEYQGYVYYATQSRLGRWQIGTAWSTRNDNFATFGVTDAEFHPMRVLNLVLYIGDGNQIAQVDAGVFSANALDIKSPLRVKCLGVTGTDLLIGTFVADNVNSTELIRWNTWSVSFSSADPIPEVGINCFLEGDNYTLVSAGTKGNIYLYNGSDLEPYKRVKGSYGAASTKRATVHPNASINFHGLTLFGISNVSGNPASQGVYSLGRTNRNYPFVLNLEQRISTANMSNVEIGAIAGVGDQFLVAWKDTTSGTAYGVDALDLTAKAEGYLVSRVIMPDRTSTVEHGKVAAAYRSLPSGASIAISRIVNHAAADAMSVVTDDKRQLVFTDSKVGSAVTCQVKVTLTPNGNSGPELELVALNIDL